MGQETERGRSESPISDANLQKLLGLLSKISYGSITLIIQNGQVVQIEKNEKVRLK